MRSISNDLEVFNLLENAGMDSFDPSESAVIEFIYNEHWHLLLFSPNGKFKGCKLFIIEQVVLSTELEHFLLPVILGMSEEEGVDQIKIKALAIIEKLISNGIGQARFFDAH